MTRRMNRLSIDIDWDADDSGYSALTSSRVIKFVMIFLLCYMMDWITL